MPSHVPPIARIRLSRSLPRLLALPALGLVLGAATVAVGVLLVPAPIGLAVAGAGALVILLAVVAAIAALSVRLEVEDAAVRVRWLGGERTYALSPGHVTRVRLRGESASPLRGGRRLLGGQLGAARLRGEEDIEIVRLAPTATAILVPTDRGRLAIAAADEAALVEALSRAARARQQLEEAARAAEPAEAAAEVEEARPAEPEVEVDPALMTGIERALHERRLAEERAAADAAAEAERLAAEDAARAEAEAKGVTVEAAPEAPRRRRLRVPSLGRPRPSAALVFLPLVAVAAVWGGAQLLGLMPDPGSEVGRLTGLALVLAGPAASVGAIMARVWWPRLVGVVVAGGLAAAVFIGRSLIGG